MSYRNSCFSFLKRLITSDLILPRFALHYRLRFGVHLMADAVVVIH